LPKKSPLLMQIYADVLDARIKPASSDEPVALGAAILGALAAGREATGHASMSQAVHAMAPQRQHLPMYRPDLRARKAYEPLYARYRELCRPDGDVARAMRALRSVL
jgi:L-ribulokinase